jgi:nicotinamide-nucleotide amidase
MKGRRLMSAEIVAVGTEILLGSLVDTNTAWLSRRLAALGVSVYRHTTVGDNKERLVAALSEAASRADLVVSTGGLGRPPTISPTRPWGWRQDERWSNIPRRGGT